jgi:RHS repeat-associated protein
MEHRSDLAGQRQQRQLDGTLPNGSEISYGNYNWMVPGQISVPGAVKNLAYDALQRPTSIEVKNLAAQLLVKRLYQYDAAGNITQIESDLGQTSYGYDSLDRLTQVRPDNALQVLGLPQEQYSYDQVGNRPVSGHQPGTWAYNSDNQMTQYPRLVPFSGGAAPIDTSVSYTAQGHTQKETNAQGTKDYGYNAAERLIKYSSTPQGQPTPSLEAGYRYDPFGRRIAKSVSEGGTTKTTYFLYSEHGLMGDTDEAGKLQKAYGFDPMAIQQGLWSTDPVWQASANNGSLTATDASYHYLHTDHLGTPVLATSKSGNTSWKAVQEAFGAAGTLPESSITMNLRFPGQYFDQETGAHYNFFRDYKPNLGRYLQSDPIGTEGSENLFGYANLNPMIYGDCNANNPLLIIRVWLILIARCELINQSYKNLELTCKSCANQNCTPEDAAANCACWAGVVQMRRKYLRMHCDYILPGSIARGSKKAEHGHNVQLANKIMARNMCCVKAAVSILD